MSLPRRNGFFVAGDRYVPVTLSPEELELLRGNDAHAAAENARLAPAQPGCRGATFEEALAAGLTLAPSAPEAVASSPSKPVGAPSPAPAPAPAAAPPAPASPRGKQQ